MFRTCLGIFLSFVILQSLSFEVFAKGSATGINDDYIPTSEIVKQIEKTLLFSKESGEKMDAYAKKDSKKSSINIGFDSSDSNAKSEFDIVVVNPKLNNINVREKEKLAYNATLVGQYEVAIELYKQVINAEPNNYYARFSLAVVYQEIGQFRQAKAIYHRMLKDDPSNKDEIVENLLAILVDESPKDALYLLSRLVVQNPTSPKIIAQAGVAYERAKDYNQAIDLFKRAADLDSSNIDYRYNLAVTYDKALQYDNAIEMYSYVEKHYTEANQSIPIEQVKKRIESIRNKT